MTEEEWSEAFRDCDRTEDKSEWYLWGYWNGFNDEEKFFCSDRDNKAWEMGTKDGKADRERE